MSQTASCCGPAPERKGKGLLLGLVYGLVPHTFCILFVVLSIVGATAATSLVKRLLYLPYLFPLLVALSAVFATVSALFYLRRNGLLSAAGVRAKWRYLTIMYGTTIGINLLFFWVVFPAVANMDLGRPAYAATGTVQDGGQLAPADAQLVTLQVDIPCPGHAPLIMDELRALPGVLGVRYQSPSYFQVSYDAAGLTVERILGLEVFHAFRARVES